MNYTHYVGIDISKLTIDVVLFSGEDHSNYHHQVFSNDYTGFDKMEKWIRSLTDTALEKILFCCEHTGLYAGLFSMCYGSITGQSVPMKNSSE